MYIISVKRFTFSIWDFGHPKFLKSQFGHPVMKILAKSLLQPPRPLRAKFYKTVSLYISGQGKHRQCGSGELARRKEPLSWRC